jgi:sec-independent protein translocase protein TatB
MFDIGWTEMALIAVVAVIVIGPKELPKVMRELGTWVARARGMSRVFMDQLEEMSRQSGIDEVRKEAEALRRLNPAREIEKTIDPEGVIARQAAELGQIGALEPPRPMPAVPPPANETTSLPTPAEPPPAQTADPVQPAPAGEPGESKP